MLLVAKVGRTVGLRGELKLHIFSDFLHIFTKGLTLTSKNSNYTIESFNEIKSVVKFSGISSVDDAKKIVNSELYMSKDETVKNCILSDDEFFWFDIIGCNIVEKDKTLGTVVDIERLPNCDYLMVETDEGLVEYAKSFMIPYIDRYIISTDVDSKTIVSIDAIEILKES